MMTKPSLLALLLALPLFGCGGALPVDGPPDMAPISCATLGGTCGAVVPGFCKDGHSLGSDPCGGGLGSACCVPGPAPTPSCTALGGTCEAVVPGYCKDGHSAGSDPCGTGIGTACCVPDPTPSCTPLPEPQGGANPASVYCTSLGYVWKSDGSCGFPDGTSCEEWSFYRGECGQAHSFCNLHGGKISHVEDMVNGMGRTYGLCTLSSGQSCPEYVYSTACGCPVE
jgi:putative hemolysin